MENNLYHRIEAVILYCSNDARFFKRCIENLLSVGIKCNVVTFSHLWMGEQEDEHLLEEQHNLFENDARYKHMHIQWYPGQSTLYWEAFGRVEASRLLDADCEYILYIDPDEIVDVEKMRKWLATAKYKKYTALKLRQHTYALSPCHLLKVKAYNTVMCRAAYAKSLDFKVAARLQYFNNDNTISRWLAKLGINSKFYIYRGKPFIHHYTGARSKEEMIKKVINWSHSADRNDWIDVIENTFKIINNKIGEHRFKLVPNQFDL